MPADQNTMLGFRVDTIGTVFLVNSRLSLKYQRQHIETQVLDKLRHRVKLFLAEWTSGHHNAFATLGHGRRLINEAIKIVLAEFRLDGQK